MFVNFYLVTIYNFFVNLGAILKKINKHKIDCINIFIKNGSRVGAVNKFKGINY